MTARRKEWLIPSVILFTLLLTPLLAIAEPSDVSPFIPSTDVELLEPSKAPTPPQAEVKNVVLCNCYLYAKSLFPSLPSTSEILQNLSASGTVAVFYYPNVGLHHYAVVLAVTDEGYYIEETNYHACKKSTRIIPTDDPNLIGFYTP